MRIEDVPIPKPNADEVLIRVVVSGSNPKDWKMPMWTGDKKHQGDDITGVVHEVGANVVEFKPGDRVAAFHEIGSANGAYAEYAIAWQHTTFHIPAKTSFEGMVLFSSSLFFPTPCLVSTHLASFIPPS